MLVSAERAQKALDELVGDDDDVAIAAVTAAELLAGVELADHRRRRDRQEFVERVLAAVPVEDYDLEVARAHGRLLAATREAGRPRGAHDLLVAATAIARGRTVVTADRAGFSELPGVTVRAAHAR